MNLIDGGVTSPKGFTAAGAHVGIKKQKKDLTLICSETEAVAAGCFTTNIVKAAPILWDENIIAQNVKIKGIVVNSGNANACTGQQGTDDTHQMAETYAELLGTSAESVLICSTGVIGVNLNMPVVVNGIKKVFEGLGRTSEHNTDCIDGIMTTDTFRKNCSVEIEVGGKTVTIGGMAKGSGMIHPNMATMLAFVTTDAAITKELLQKALSDSVKTTFNMISVDGDTSTNDTILVLANGMAGNDLISAEGSDYEKFKEALHAVTKYLAISVARDGEGATKLFEVNVKGAATYDDAVKLSKSVVSSSLIKAMLFGADANVGRVMCAMGYSGGYFDQNKVDLIFRSATGCITLVSQGNPVLFDEDTAKKVLSEKDIFIDIFLADGDSSATAWGCDLTYDYVKINGDYRS